MLSKITFSKYTSCILIALLIDVSFISIGETLFGKKKAVSKNNLQNTH